MSRITIVFIVGALGQREARFRRVAALTALTAFVGSFAWLLFVLPVYLGFALSVGSAVAWCIWIEHHPEPPSVDLTDPERPLGSANAAEPSETHFHYRDIDVRIRRQLQRRLRASAKCPSDSMRRVSEHFL